MLYLKQSTAATVKVGPFVDSTDGVTPETGLTISQADIRLSKNGGAFAQTNNAAGATHDENGWYGVPLDTTDTGTLGRLQVAVYESGALPVWAEFMVVAAHVFDGLIAGGDYLQVDAVQVEGGDATDAINAACDTAMTDYDAATGTELAAVEAKIDTIDGIVDAILVDTGTTLDGIVDAILADTDELQAELADGGRTDLLIDAILADTNELQVDDTPGALAAIDAKIDTIDGIVDAIVVDTAEIGAAGAGLTAVPWNAAWDAEVQSEVADGLAAYDPPTKAELDSGLAGLNDPTAAAVADAVWDEAIADHAGVGSTGAALAAATAPSAATVADAVWDELVADHAGVGSTGAALAAAGGSGDPWATALPGAYGAGTAGNIVGNNLDAAISDVPTVAENRAEMDSNSTQLAAIVADTAELQAELADGGRTDLLVDAILADTNELQTDDVPGLIAALNDPAASAIADAVWDEAIAGHVGTGSFGEEVQAHSLSTEVAALNDLSSGDAQTAAAAALTAYDPPTKAELDSGLAGLNDLSSAEAQVAAAAALTAYDPPTKAELDSGLAGLNDPTAAAIADAVWDEAIAGHVGAGTTGAALSTATAPTAAAVADAVWDETVADHSGVGSTGAALAAAGGSGDPWSTALPGSYGAGTAGHIIGTNLDEVVSDVPEDVWSYTSRTLTQSAASVAAAVAGSNITILRGDTLSAALTGLGALTGYVSLDFSVKRTTEASDNDAIIRIRLNASTEDDGLLRLNGAAATAANGSITIDSEALGNITIALAAAGTQELLRGVYCYDVQMITATGVSTLTSGVAEVTEDVTRLVV